MAPQPRSEIALPPSSGVPRDARHRRLPSPETVRLLQVILAFGILSTGIHYTHNFVAADDYPAVGPIGETTYQVGTILIWPLMTGLAVWAFGLYRRGDLTRAHTVLAGYCITGLSSPLHFVGGTPDVPAVFFATIFTDFASGAAMLAFVVWSSRHLQPAG